MERVRELMNTIRFLREHPTLHPVVEISRIGLPLRRRNAGQFVVVYSYFEPSPSEPCGLVSMRSIRHATEQDVLLGVEEHRARGRRGRPSLQNATSNVIARTLRRLQRVSPALYTLDQTQQEHTAVARTRGFISRTFVHIDEHSASRYAPAD
jgi:hypothetical protein